MSVDFSNIDRRRYLTVGLALMAVKYALEAAVVYVATRRFWPLHVFLSPLSSMRSEALPSGSEPLLVGLAFLSVPFLFVGLSYSVRRAANAGISPWWGLGFLVPIANYLTMAVLASLPTRIRENAAVEVAEAPRTLDGRTLLRASLFGIGSAVALGTVASALAGSTGSYGAALFMGVPVVMGVLVGAALNEGGDRGRGVTLRAGAVAGLATALSLLLFAVEGAICVLMVVPVALPLILLGAEVGRQVVLLGARRSGNVAACLALPVLAFVEPSVTTVPLHHVTTVVEVDAPPDVVFEHVVAFPPIDAPRPWYFRTGIAVPLSARIEGTGVGAVRHCEFTTGAFVEPITHWEPGRRLAFDVVSSPPPMEEWSPYRSIHPAHLDSTMRSRRGEFRIVPLPGGRSRLEGHTYYEMMLEPDPYFALFGDVIIHLVHERVLRHVAREAERDARTSP